MYIIYIMAEKRRFSYQKISEKHPQFSEFIKKARKENPAFPPDSSGIFGEKELEKLDLYKDQLFGQTEELGSIYDSSFSDKLSEKYEHIRRSLLISLRTELMRLNESGEAAEAFWNTVMPDANITNKITASSEFNEKGYELKPSIIFQTSTVSLDTFEAMARKYVSVTQEKRRELYARIPELRKDFEARIAQHPSYSDKSGLLRQRLDRIEYVYIDPINAIKQECNASFNPTTERIIISDRIHSRSNVDGLPNTYADEVTHVLAGRTYLLKTNNYTHESKIQAIRTGVGFLENGFLHWLNEAKTVSIVQSLGYPEMNAYPHYRALEHVIFSADSDPTLSQSLDDAYFENYDVDVEESSRLRHWKTMWKKVHETHGDKTLLRLDKKVKQTPLPKTIK